MKTWTRTAPSNIALIKYMGKVESAVKNKPTNTSLSFTLPHLLSYVQLEEASSTSWEPLAAFADKKFEKLELSEKGAARFLAHLQMLKDHFGYKGEFKVRSANGFPSDCGLASSASSFAALTHVGCVALSELTGRSLPSVHEMAGLSRLGSGSSCRSFFAPWSIWTPETVTDVPGLPGDFIHQVVVVEDRVKAVSSSEAHKRVTTSDLFDGRPQRADRRVEEFITALRKDEWSSAFEIAWAEFWDMHALFETSKPSFGYMTGGSLEVLNFVRSELTASLPLVTMDAGPNVHLLYRNDDRGRASAKQLATFASGKFNVFSLGL